MWNCQSPFDSTCIPRIGNSIHAKSLKEIVKMDKEENKEPKRSVLGNKVEGTEQSNRKAKSLLNLYTNMSNWQKRSNCFNTPLTLPKKNGKKVKKLISIWS